MSTKKKVIIGLGIFILSFIVFIVFSFFLIKREMRLAKEKHLIFIEKQEKTSTYKSDDNKVQLVTYPDRIEVFGVEEEKNRLPVNSDKETFEYLRGGLSRDKSSVYFNKKKIDELDSDSIEIITDHCRRYFKDKNYVYYVDNADFPKKIESADPKTFKRSYGSCYNWFSRDKNNIYYYGEKMNYISSKIYGLFFDYFGSFLYVK